MKIWNIILVIVISLVMSFVVRYVAPTSGGEAVAAKESVYDRVLRTGVLRCGYADWPPAGFVKNPQTGEVSGIMADVTEAVAAKLNLKVEWTENTGWGSFIESLRDHRIDVFCSGPWQNAARGRYVGFSVPVFYSAVYPYVAASDHRFDKDLSAANAPTIRISAMDGEMSDIIAKERFPKAVEISVPQLGQYTDIFMNVATHKADIVFNEPSIAASYMASNPNSLRLAQDRPFQTFPTCLAVDIHEVHLRDMLNSALVELQNQGVVDEIISKYSTDPKVFLRVTKPYQ